MTSPQDGAAAQTSAAAVISRRRSLDSRDALGQAAAADPVREALHHDLLRLRRARAVHALDDRRGARHVPMARTVADLALMLAAIAGPDPRVPISYPADTRTFVDAVKTPRVKGLRIAWSADLGVTPVDAEIARIVEASRDVMQENLVKNVDFGLTLTAERIGRAERLRTQLFHRVRDFLGRYDLLVTPTTAVPPFPVEQPYPTEINGAPMENYVQWVLLTYAFTVVGLPAISVPCGFTRDGLPVGLQIAGRWRDEPGVLPAAAAFEEAAPWAHWRPPGV